MRNFDVTTDGVRCRCPLFYVLLAGVYFTGAMACDEKSQTGADGHIGDDGVISTDGPVGSICPYEKTSITLSEQSIIWRHATMPPVVKVMKELSEGFDRPLDIDLGWYTKWSLFTAPDSVVLADDKIENCKKAHLGAVARLKHDLSTGQVVERLLISPCHDLGTIGGDPVTTNSACHVSPVLPAYHDDWIAYVARAAEEFLSMRQGEGAFSVQFGGYEIPRELWTAADNLEASYLLHPEQYLALAREVWQTVQAAASPIKVMLRLPGIETNYLRYMHFEDSNADSFQLEYSDKKEQKFVTRASIDEALVLLFGQHLKTSDLNEQKAKILLSVDCDKAAQPKDGGYVMRVALCNLVQRTAWIRRILSEIPLVFVAPERVPLEVNMHLYGGGYQEQMSWAATDGAVRRALASYPEVDFIVYEQGSPYSPMREESLEDIQSAYSELAKDIPKVVFGLLGSGIKKVPTRPPISEVNFWAEFGMYGMTDETGTGKRAAFFASQVLLSILGGGTEGATIISGRIDDVEVYQYKPADGGSSTFVLWSRSKRDHKIRVRLATKDGLVLLKSPTQSAPTAQERICVGSDLCELVVGDTPVYLLNVDTIEFEKDMKTGECVVPL